MQKITGLLVLLLLVLASNAFGKAILDSYIVRLETGKNENAVIEASMAAERATGGVIGHRYFTAIQGFSIYLPEGLASQALLRVPGVVDVEPNLKITTCSLDIPTGVRRINAHNSPIANIGSGQSVDVDIAIIDTGIDNHPDLNIAGGRNFTAGQPASYGDIDGHGTHVAGIAGAKYNSKTAMAGVAPGARLWALRVFGNIGPEPNLGDVIKAVDWVTKNADTIDVVNMSLSATGVHSSFHEAIKQSVAKGVVYVAAAGNSARDVYGPDGIFGTSDDTIPAAYSEVMTVSAMVDTDGNPGGRGASTSVGPDDTFASFSNYSNSVVADNPVNSTGKAIDLLVPGVFIYSTDKNSGYSTKSGTSMAAPHAAGLAALYIAANGKPDDAAGVYALRQALIDSGLAQASARGLADGGQSDPDEHPENIGYVTVGDLTYNGAVNFADFAVLASAWTTDEDDEGFLKICDLYPDSSIDIADVAVFADNWLTGLD